ncbi:MAG: DNA repair putative endonuclease MmcB [Parvularculaceae bacterium]|nr:DNA repair putative endonuclease MmcB [Parvularculaceae bacterium]
MRAVSESSSTSSVARPDVTAALTRGVARLFVDLGLTPLAEMTLANGRRADLVGLDQNGRILIAEVKSCRADFEADAKWADYLDYCDAFYFAVGADFPTDILPSEEGLIIADAFGGAVLREASERPLVAARRKAVTLRYARQAASRAHFRAEPGDAWW